MANKILRTTGLMLNHLSPTISTTNDQSERMSVDRNHPSPFRQQFRTSNRGSFNESVSNSHSPSASKALSSNNNSHDNSLLTNETLPPEISDRDPSIDRSHSTQTKNSDNLLLAENETSINVSMKNVSKSGGKTKLRSRSRSISDEESTSALHSDDRSRTSVRKRKASGSQTYLSDPETSPPASKKNSTSLRTTRQHSRSEINEELSNTLNSKTTYVKEKHDKVKQLSKKLRRKGNTSKHKKESSAVEKTRLTRKTIHSGKSNLKRKASANSETISNQVSDEDDNVQLEPYNSTSSLTHTRNRKDFSKKTVRKKISVHSTDREGHEQTDRNTNKKSSAVERNRLTHKKIHSGKSNLKRKTSTNSEIISNQVSDEDDNIHFDPDKSHHSSIVEKGRIDMTSSSFTHTTNRKYFPKKTTKKTTAIYSNDSEGNWQNAENRNKKSSAKKSDNLTHKGKTSGKSKYFKGKAPVNNEHITVNQVPDVDDNAQFDPDNSRHSLPMEKSQIDITPSSSVPHSTNRKSSSLNKRRISAHQNDVSVVPTLSSPQDILNLASTSKSAKNAKLDKRKRRRKNIVIASSPIRRSSRTRMKPLAFWAGERIRQRLVSGNVCTEYQEKQWEDTYDKINEMTLNMFNTKAKRRNLSPKATKQMSTQKNFKVICDNKGGEEEAEVLFLYQQVSSTLAPVFNQNQSSPSYFITKTFGNGDLSSGYIKLKTQKSEQVSPDHNIFYVVLQGKVSVRINNSEIVASVKDSFIIPKHNRYSISNLSNNPSLLHYSTVKQPIFDFQEN